MKKVLGILGVLALTMGLIVIANGKPPIGGSPVAGKPPIGGSPVLAEIHVTPPTSIITILGKPPIGGLIKTH